MTPAVGTAAFGVHAEPALAAADLFDQEPDLTEYICHWSRRIGCIYVETPKVACTTIKRVLQAAELGVERRHEMPDDVHARATSPLLAPGHDPEGFALAIWDTATFRFTFVRNPYSRILSCWLDKMVSNETERGRMAPMLGLDPNTPPSLAEFLEAIAAQPERERDPHWTTQTHLLNPQASAMTSSAASNSFAASSRACAAFWRSKPMPGTSPAPGTPPMQAPRSNAISATMRPP
jgi:hypothetical protein